MFLDSWGIGLRPLTLQKVESQGGLRDGTYELGEVSSQLGVILHKWPELVCEQVVREGNERPSPDYLPSPALVAGELEETPGSPCPHCLQADKLMSLVS